MGIDPVRGETMIVFCPLAFEARAVARALRDIGNPVQIETTGPGAEAVARAVRAVGPRAAWYVLAGVAGGLREGAVGAPAIGTVLDLAARRWAPTVAAGEATIVGVDAVVAGPEEKRALAERTGAGLVDTESHGFARACTELGVEWGVVRGVSDRSGETLPREVVGWVDARGRTRVGRVALDLVRRPGLVPALRALGARSTAAMAEVGRRIGAIAEEQAGILARAMMVPVPPAIALLRRGSVIVFGGSFDPPHRGHAILPERTRAAVEAASGEPAWLMYVPAARSPLKAEGPVAAGSDRLEMLRRATAANARAVVSDIEITRAALGGGPSYTIDTLGAVRGAIDPGVRLRLLIGADQAAEFHRWKEPRKIVSVAEPLVMLRGPTETADGLIGRMRASGFWSEEELGAWRGRVMDVGTMDVSATEARRAAARGDWPAVEEMVGKEVAGVIREKGLYGSGAGAQRA